MLRMPRAHVLKTESQFMSAVTMGTKPFEVRKNDRDFRVGDFLVLQEIDEAGNPTLYSVVVRVTFILDDPRFVQSGFVVMGIK